MNAERGSDEPEIETRSMAYAVRAVNLFRHLKKSRDEAASVLGRQYLRSATSIGANLVEARSGESRKDFVHKCAIAQKEAHYWLRLIEKVGLVDAKLIGPLIKETDEILRVVTAIIRKAKQNAKRR